MHVGIESWQQETGEDQNWPAKLSMDEKSEK